MRRRPLLDRVDDWYVDLGKRIYWKGREMGGRSRWGEKLPGGPDEPFCDLLTYVGGTLMPRARQVALTPIRVPGTYRLRRQE